MRRLAIIAAVVSALAGQVQGAPAQEVDKEALRKLVRLPRMRVEAGLPFLGYNAFFRPPKAVDPKEIEALEKSLQGDASDAPRYLKLAELYAQLKRPDAAAAAFAKAESLLKPLIESNPKDVALQLQYARSLEGAEKFDAAEKSLRAIVRQFPKHSEAWRHLAEFLTEKALHQALTIFREEAKSKPLEGNRDVLACWQVAPFPSNTSAHSINASPKPPCVLTRL
jgi:tetratricopeptide (TPR) repeat protein